jgi:hypothetical protein
MKDNRLIFEINRIGQLMGSNKELSLIVEGPVWLTRLTKLSFSNVDDLIKIFKTNVGDITSKNIDELITELGTSITPAEKIALKNSLVSHLDDINKSTDSFFDLIGRNPRTLDPILQKLTNDSGVMSSNVVSNLTKKIIDAAAKESTEFTLVVSNYSNYLIRQLSDINSLGVIINSETDLYNLIKNDIRKTVKTHLDNNKNIVVQNMDDYCSGIFNRVKENPNFKDLINKLKKNGTIANNKPKNIPLNDFNNIYARNRNGEIIYKPTEAIIGGPELSRSVDGEIETLPIDVSNKYNEIKDKAREILSNTEKEFLNDVNGWLRNTTETNQIGFNRQPDNYLNTTDDVMESYSNIRTFTPDDISISDSLLDLNGNLVGNWSSIFYNKIFRGNLPTFILNKIRWLANIRKDPSFFVRQYEKTTEQILETYELLNKSLDGGKANSTYYSLIETLGKLQRKLKLDLELAQKFKDPVFNTTDERIFHIMFEELAEKIEKESGLSYKESSELLKKLRGETESGGRILTSEQSIENMIVESKKYGLPFGKRIEFEWEKLKNGSSVAEFKTMSDDATKAAGISNKLQLLTGNLITKIVKSPKTWMYIFFNTFTHMGTVLKLLKGRGSNTLLGNLVNYATAYLYLQIVQFIVIPITDLISLGLYNWLMPNNKIDKIDTEVSWKRFFKEFEEQIPFIGEQWKWYPYYQPFTSIGLPGFGLKEAPIPKLITDYIKEYVIKDASTKNSEDAKEEEVKANKRLTDDWNSLIDDEGQKIREVYSEMFTKTKTAISTGYITQSSSKLSSDEAKTLANHLFFKTPQTIQNDLELLEDDNSEDLNDKIAKIKEKSELINQDLKQFKLKAPIWVCLKPPKINDFGEPIGCDGTSYRVVVNNYKSVVYTNCLNDFRCYNANIYYVTKASGQENKGMPNTGSNGIPLDRLDDQKRPICNHPNLRPIKELIPSLK